MPDNILFATIFIVAFFILFVIGRKKKKEKAHFDEMQLSIRARAYKKAFFTVVCGMVILIFLSAASLSLYKIIDIPTQMCIVLMTGIIVFAVYCIIKDAFYGFDYKKQSYIYIALFNSLLNFGLGVWSIMDGSIWDKGTITFINGGANLIVGIGFFIIFVTLLLKKFGCKSMVE